MQRMSLEDTVLAQIQASDNHKNIWVGANAGTGKTKVLTQRYVRFLLAGAAPESILCITFTNNAAAEMRERVLRTTRGWLELDDTALRAALEESCGEAPSEAMLTRARSLFLQLSDAPHKMHFTTIHGFCQDMLQRFPLEAGIAPHFTVIEEAASKRLLKNAASGLFRQSRFAKESRLNEAMQCFAQHMGDGAIEDVLGLMVNNRHALRQAVREAQGEDALHRQIDAVCEQEDGADVGAAFIDATQEKHGVLQQFADTLAQYGTAKEQTLVPVLREWLAVHDWDEGKYQAFRNVFLKKNEDEIRAKAATKKCVEAWPEIEDVFIDEGQRILRFEEAKKRAMLAKLSHAYVTLSQEMSRLYEQQKQAHNALDFDDLIEATLRLLERSDMVPWVLYKMDRRIAHLLLDEAQDTSPEQWEIILKLCEEYISQSDGKTVFVVGDVKQSIYGFQGAEPAQISAHKARLETYCNAQSETGLETVRMERSFRCTQAVLDVVDGLFAEPSRRYSLQYSDDAVSHGVHRANEWGRVECWPLVVKPEVPDVEPFSLPLRYEVQQSAGSALAEQIAQQIKTWLGGQVMLPSAGRPIQPKDILILVRSRSTFVHELARTLKRGGVPLAGTDRLQLSSHLMVQDIIALCQWALLPEDDYSLACVLKSPMLCMGEEALFELCHGRVGSVWDALRAKGDAAIVAKLNELREWAETLAVGAFFDRLFSQWHFERLYMPFYRAEAGEVLHAFMRYMRGECDRAGASLTMILHQFSESDVSIVQRAGAGANEVRIMTVHGAKGLEAPIVFLPDTTSVKTNKDTLFFDEDSGVPLYAPLAKYRADVFAKALDKARRKDAEESLRLLYVAMTRARDWLIVAGHSNTKNVNEASWYAMAKTQLQAMEAREEEGALIYECGDVYGVAKEETAAAVKTYPDALEQPLEIVAPERMKNPSGAGEHVVEVYETVGEVVSSDMGTLRHRLIELLAPLPAPRRSLALAKAVCGAGIDEQTFEAIYEEMFALLGHADLSALFGEDTRYEVAVRSGEHYGIIDCVVARASGYDIIDFKTGIAPAEEHIPAHYRAQLEAYRGMMLRAYPEQEIRAAILWTQAQRLDWL